MCSTFSSLLRDMFARDDFYSFKGAAQFNENEGEIGGGLAVTGGEVT